MNTVNIIGNLTKDPDVRYTTGAEQTAVCRMNIAVNEGYGEKQTTSFIPVVVFGKTAENCEKYLSKGSKVAVNGRLKSGKYEKDGHTVYTLDVIANAYGGIEFLNSKKGSQAAGLTTEDAGSIADAPQGFSSLQDDDIPF